MVRDELIGVGEVSGVELPQVLVLGTGLIGSRVARDLGAKALSYQKGQVSPANWQATHDLLRALPRGSIVVNATGATKVDAIEHEREQGQQSPAYLLNVDGTRHIARACLEAGHYLVQFGSETAFGLGEPDRRIMETSRPQVVMAPDKRSWYGTTTAYRSHVMYKYFAERGKGLILGIQYPSDIGAGYLAKALKFPKLVEDVQMTPSLIAEFGWIIATAYLARISGVTLHAVGTETSPAKFVGEAKRRLEITDDVPRVSLVNEPGKAVRPQFHYFDRAETQELLNCRLRTTDQQLDYLCS